MLACEPSLKSKYLRRKDTTKRQETFTVYLS